MTLSRRAFALSVAATLALAIPAFADEPAPFVTDKDVNLLQILPPPPAKDSEQTKKELADFHTFEATRDKARADKAVADDEETITRFLAGMGITIDESKLPATKALFDRVGATEGAVVDPAKDKFGRLRPYLADETIKPLLKPKKSGSYPSGHTTVGILFAVTMSQIAPEKSAEFFARADDFAYSRYVAGMHYLSDFTPSKMGGAAISVELLKNADYLKAVEAAKPELRAALGLK
jgi:acid phosphatase (class A)